LTGTRLNHADDLRVKVVFVQKQAFGFSNGRQAFFVFIVVDRRADDFLAVSTLSRGTGMMASAGSVRAISGSPA
jgi:hypothetical protein